jgi:hypothetical protein
VLQPFVVLIGNTKYQFPVNQLASCERDVELMEDYWNHLEGVKAEVRPRNNLDKASMHAFLTELGKELRLPESKKYDLFVFYFSGHGDKVGGLLPESFIC